MKAILIILAILLLVSQPAAGQIFSDATLLKAGTDYYRSNCIRGSNYYFAYLQRNPPDLQPSSKNRIERLIASCTPDKFYSSMDASFDDPGNSVKRCNAYAGVAVGQYIASRNTGCDDGQGGWHDHYAEHFNWCLQEDAAVVRSEVKRRQDYLFECAR